jgi:hypothetical protein
LVGHSQKKEVDEKNGVKPGSQKPALSYAREAGLFLDSVISEKDVPTRAITPTPDIATSRTLITSTAPRKFMSLWLLAVLSLHSMDSILGNRDIYLIAMAINV